MTLNPTRSTVLHIRVTTIHEAQFSVHSLYSRRFRDTGHFETMRRMIAKMTLDHTRSMCSICITSVPEYQLSVHFALQPAVFERSSFWDNALNEPKITLNPTRSNVPIYVLLVSTESQILVHFALRPAVFEIRPFWDKCTEWPQNDLEHYKAKDTPYKCY